MWIYKFLLFALIISLECFVNGQDPDYLAVSEKRDGSKYCGKHLANALKLVCGGVYNSMFKKSDSGLDWDNMMKEIELEEPTNEAVDNLFRPRSQAQMFYPHRGIFRRRTRGIVDECCHKSCSVTEMMGYCARQK